MTETVAVKWGNQGTVRAIYGISRQQLLEWAKAGTVRSTRPDPDKKADRRQLFCCADIEAVLERLSRGLPA